MDIVVTGAAGRLGGAVADALSAAGHRVIRLLRSDLDICNAAQVSAVMRGLAPHAIINCAAYNAVDAAEGDCAAAFAANATGPARLAEAARELDALFVHYSTDFVFDGCASTPYVEEDPTNPLSAYGASKLAGEEAARTAPRHYILRVASLFGGRAVHGHRSTIDYLIDELEMGKPVRALIDRTATPSYVPDVVRASMSLLNAGAPYGIYHCVNTGATTWFNLAAHIAASLGCQSAVHPVTTAELTPVARRPRYCALANAKLEAAGVEMPRWEAALERHLAARAPRVTERLAEVC